MVIIRKYKSVIAIFLILIFLVFLEKNICLSNNYPRVETNNISLKITPLENVNNYFLLHNERLPIQIKPDPIDKAKISKLFFIALSTARSDFQNIFIWASFPSKLKLVCILRI